MLATVSAAAEKKRREDEAEFRWIHDVDAFRVIPFRLRCTLARECRRQRVSRGEVVYSRGEDADHAVIVVEGRCQIRVPEDEAPGGDERGETTRRARDDDRHRRGGVRCDASRGGGGGVEASFEGRRRDERRDDE